MYVRDKIPNDIQVILRQQAGHSKISSDLLFPAKLLTVFNYCIFLAKY